MGELYEVDVLEWSEHQARLLRQHVAGERTNEAPDWANIIEEVESVGRSQLHAVEVLLLQAREGVALVASGISRLLAHMGITASTDAAPSGPVRMAKVPSLNYFVYAPDPGLLEPAVELGDAMRTGQLCGALHFVDNPARAPVPCHFKTDGFVICKRHFGRAERGDCVAHLAFGA